MDTSEGKLTLSNTFVIAEAGVNHNGDLGLALEMIDAAASAGADAVKFQTAIPEEVVAAHAPKAEYQKLATGTAESQLEMVRKLHFVENRDTAYAALVERAAARGIEFLSTPFDLPSLRFLVEKLGLETIKLASGEITNGPLLLEAARSGRDIILSTGMAALEEVGEALGVLAFGMAERHARPSLSAFAKAAESPEARARLAAKVTLLHCVTAYPAPFEAANLRAMDTLRGAFGLPVGISDHTTGIVVAVAAAARGATVIEKHFTMDRELPGPDHAASLEPDEFKAMVAAVRDVERALGDGRKEPQPCELPNIPIARRSVVAREPIAKGMRFTEKNLAVKRPGTGISPMRYWELIDKFSTRDYDIDALLDEGELNED
jgi:N-acetylneuraminate synthase